MIQKIIKNSGKIQPWFISYGLQRVSQALRHNGRHKPTHIFICVCDHFEPLRGGVNDEIGLKRVQRWVAEYKAIADRYKDIDGAHPMHTIFYPIEEYRPRYMELLADFCRQGYAEVEIHLHHDNDTADNLRKTLLDFKELLSGEYGLLCRDKNNKEVKYGFIHGNWALDNSRKDGRKCGVNNELEVLEQTGCYADFTMPSAPDETQISKINSIYYAVDDPRKPGSHSRGIAVKGGKNSREGLLMVQGPLMLNWQSRKLGIFPRIENSEISYSSMITPERMELWRRANIHIGGRPEYVFIKLYTHGCQDDNARYMLSGGLDSMFSYFRDNYNNGDDFMTHYVTSREMVNVINAVEDGVVSAEINGLMDYRLERIGSR